MVDFTELSEDASRIEIFCGFFAADALRMN